MSRECDKAAEQVYSYLDGQISWYKRWRVRRHLADCPPCCDRFEFEQRFLDVVHQKSAQPPPPELLGRLETFLRENGAGDAE